MNVADPSISWALGTNVFAGPLQPVGAGHPAIAIYTFQVSGPENIWIKGGGSIEPARMKTWLRVPVNQLGLGLEKSKVLVRALDRNPPAGYYLCKSLSSAMSPMSADPQGHIVWVCDFLTERRETA